MVLYRVRSWRLLYATPYSNVSIHANCICVVELIGYIGRAASAQQTPDWTLGPYIIQSLFLLVAPALFAASIYMTLGRIILLVDGEAHSIIRKNWLTKLFVGGDVLSFLMQGSGGGMMAGSASMANTGEKLVVGGLFVQLLFFGLFIVTAGIFHFRLHKVPTAASLMRDVPWKKHMYTLYGASLLIMVRSIFRVVEYLQGYDGYLLRHEVYLYIFDAVLMFVVMLIFNWSHPSEVKALLRGGLYSKGFFKMEDIRQTSQLP